MPLVATWAALHLLLKWVDTVLLLIPQPYRPENFLPFPIPGLGLIVLGIVLLLVGFG